MDSELEFINILWGLRTEQEEGYRTGPPGYRQNWFLGSDTWAGTFKGLWSPGIDSKTSIPPAYVAWQAGTITLLLLGA